ncbi:MAG: hypothetical protein HYS05_14295 [Acidobacteria bacterium]|nr:hypothetical protein [Acidobacteriota bacterium]
MTLIHRTLKTLRERGLRETRRRIAGRFSSRHVSYGLTCDLGRMPRGPACRLGLRLRPLADRDVPLLFDHWAHTHEPVLVDERLELIASGAGRSLVAVDPEDRPCFMIWMATSGENERLRAVFGSGYPVLQPGEAVLDGMFVPKGFEGMNVVPAAIREVAALAKGAGLHRLIIFSYHSRPAALFALRQAGFLPYCVKVDSRRFFFHRVIFRPFSTEDFGGKSGQLAKFALFAGTVGQAG